MAAIPVWFWGDIMSNVVLDQKKISKILPQAYPFIMIDRIIDFKRDESLVAVKNITGNEWVFEGQMYKTDVFPETLVIEAAAQTALVFYVLNNDIEGRISHQIRLSGIKSKFSEAVHIGDQLRLTTGEFKMLKARGYIDVDIARDDVSISKVKIFYVLPD